MEFVQDFEWNIAGEIVREAYRGLFEGFEESLSTAAAPRSEDDSVALKVPEARLCAAWKSFIEDVHKDRREREVIKKSFM